MRRRTSLLWTLLICAAAESAEPVPQQSQATPAKPAPALAKPPLDLRIGDIRKYMTPEEFRAAVNVSDEPNTVIVEANRPLLPMKFEEPVPGGIIAPFWALAHPTQAWRIFVPDLKAPPTREPADKIPPPVFRWGP
jgi:hypothetical protein